MAIVCACKAQVGRHAAALLQVVFLLDVATHALRPLTSNLCKWSESRLGDLCFTPNSNMILTACYTWDCALLRIHSRTGELLHRIRPKHTCHGAAVACLSSQRAVWSLCSRGFTVWDLLTGQQTAAVTLPANEHHNDDSEREDDLATPHRSGLFCTDNTGAKLAYVEPYSVVVHLYGAVTLQELGSFSPPAGMVPRVWCLSGLCMGASLSLLQVVSDDCIDHSFLGSLEGATSRPWNVMHFDMFKAQALSKDDAFLAQVCNDGPFAHFAVIQVFDTRSGKRVLKHKLRLPEEEVDLGPVAVSWVGSSLLVITNISPDDSCRSVDHIIRLQF